MHLPFFKNKRVKNDDVLEVKVTDKASKEDRGPYLGAVPTVATPFAPDLSDYAEDYAPPPPKVACSFPFIILAIILLCTGVKIYSLNISDAMRIKSKILKTNNENLKLSNTTLALEAKALDRNIQDLEVLKSWASYRVGFRRPIVALLSTAAGKVQIKRLDVKRIDPRVNRYRLVIHCIGTKENLDKTVGEWQSALNNDDFNSLLSSSDQEDDTRRALEFIITAK